MCSCELRRVASESFSREILVDGNPEDVHSRRRIHLGMRAHSLTFLTRGEEPDLRAPAFTLLAVLGHSRVEVREMQIEPFELERWQSVWENKVELNISESGVHPLTTAELVPDPEQLRRILEVQLLYPQTNGSEELRSLIASMYPGATADNVLVTCGGSEANFVSTWALIDPGDEVVFMMPNYMQIAGVARAFGATVKPLWLRESLDWGINVDDLAALGHARRPN